MGRLACVEQRNLFVEQIQHSGCTSSVKEFDLESNNTLAYPNPTDDIIYIKSSQNITSIELYDMNSKLLTSKNNAEQISLKNFEKGTYQLKIIKENGKTVIRK